MGKSSTLRRLCTRGANEKATQRSLFDDNNKTANNNVAMRAAQSDPLVSRSAAAAFLILFNGNATIFLCFKVSMNLGETLKSPFVSTK